jgi:hypothetical protein
VSRNRRVQQSELLAAHESGVRCLMADAAGEAYTAFATVQQASADADGVAPHIELRQPVQPRVGKRNAVVGADRQRHPVLAKRPLEDGAFARPARGEQAVHAEQGARVLIGDRERKAVDAVACAELPLEVSGPHRSAPWCAAAPCPDVR